MGASHYSVLLKESVDALVVNGDGFYVDCTFGRGGHSRAVLERLSSNGRLVGFDKDPDAVAVGKALEKEDSRFRIVHNSFTALKSDALGVERVDGVLMDLGVSSPQLDNAERGFSFLGDGPLDMRMNNAAGQTAADWINTASDEEMAFVFREYGEERFAKRMARAVVKAREKSPILTTARFASIISEANPKWEKGKHPATRVFQAVRIFINSELDDLRKGLDAAIEKLHVGGRLVVISFHSLEDRIVKRFIRDKAKGKEFPMGMPVTEDMLEKSLRAIGKAVKANESEVAENIRSRSAVMRVAEKI